MEPTAAARACAAVVSGVVGGSIGSFLNVVVYRVPRAMSVVRPRSHCPRCGTELGNAENVPVLSWLILRGRCRHCHEPISPRYPIVELATLGLFVAFSLVLRSFAPVVSLDCLAAGALAGGLIALEGFAVPRSVALTTVLGAATLALVSVLDHGNARLAWAAIGAGACLVVTTVLPRLARTVMRGGLGQAVVLTAVAWGAGWLWKPGGLVVAGLSLIACAPAVRVGSRAAVASGVACFVSLCILIAAAPLGHA
jgi:leader peptidase (prepilin peptidase) / N-methyltransferase